jgi:hypothetical protein
MTVGTSTIGAELSPKIPRERPRKYSNRMSRPSSPNSSATYAPLRRLGSSPIAVAGTACVAPAVRRWTDVTGMAAVADAATAVAATGRP